MKSEDKPACDVEAVLIALYGRVLVTADTKMGRELDEDLRLIVRPSWG